MFCPSYIEFKEMCVANLSPGFYIKAVLMLSFPLLVLSDTTLPVCRTNTNAQIPLSDLFPGLFVNLSILGDNGQYKGPVASLIKYEDTENGETILLNTATESATTSATGRERRSTSCKNTLCCICCRTKKTFAIPLLIVYQGQTMTTASTVSGIFQILSLGRCRGDAMSGECAECKCVEEYRPSWILIEDSSVSWYPRVRFLPVIYPYECQCINPG